MGAIALLAVIGGVAGNGGSSTPKADSQPTPGTAIDQKVEEKAGATDTTSETKAKSDTKAEAATTPGLKDTVKDGKFAFTVSKVKCGVSKVGNEYLNAEAQGQFCLVTIKVENIGNRAQTFFGDNQKVFNEKGQEFSADTSAGIYLEDAKSFIEEINPGNSLTGQVVFDVPKSAKITSIELHDSAFSGGVTVDLTH